MLELIHVKKLSLNITDSVCGLRGAGRVGRPQLSANLMTGDSIAGAAIAGAAIAGSTTAGATAAGTF